MKKDENLISVKTDPNMAINIIKHNLVYECFEIFSDKENVILYSAYYADQVVEIARNRLLPFFENYIFSNINEEQKKLIESEKEIGILLYSNKRDKAAKINDIKKLIGKKGFDSYDINDFITHPDSVHVNLWSIGRISFFYIVCRLNYLICSESKNYKKVLDGMRLLREQGLSLGINNSYLDCISDNYKKYIDKLNLALEEMSRERNMKISERIRRNEFIVALDEAIEYLIEDKRLNRLKTPIWDYSK